MRGAPGSGKSTLARYVFIRETLLGN
jgi:adenylate kinase family enzyme